MQVRALKLPGSRHFISTQGCAKTPGQTMQSLATAIRIKDRAGTSTLKNEIAGRERIIRLCPNRNIRFFLIRSLGILHQLCNGGSHQSAHEV